MYVFPDKGSAEKALTWGGSTFVATNFAELHVVGGIGDLQPLDANWISRAATGPTYEDWVDRYWSGDAFPEEEPIWEILTNRRSYLLGTDLREKAFSLIERHMPKAVSVAEIGRLAALVESDMGNIACYFRQHGSTVIAEHWLDWRDANNPKVLERLAALRASGQPVNDRALKVGADQGLFHLPDLTKYDFSLTTGQLRNMPWLTIASV